MGMGIYGLVWGIFEYQKTITNIKIYYELYRTPPLQGGGTLGNVLKPNIKIYHELHRTPVGVRYT